MSSYNSKTLFRRILSGDVELAGDHLASLKPSQLTASLAFLGAQDNLPIHALCIHHNHAIELLESIVDAMVGSDCSLLSMNAHKQTPLRCLIESACANVDAFKLLIREAPTSLLMQDFDGKLPSSCLRNLTEEVKQLIVQCSAAVNDGDHATLIKLCGPSDALCSSPKKLVTPTESKKRGAPKKAGSSKKKVAKKEVAKKEVAKKEVAKKQKKKTKNTPIKMTMAPAKKDAVEDPQSERAIKPVPASFEERIQAVLRVVVEMPQSAEKRVCELLEYCEDEMDVSPSKGATWEQRTKALEDMVGL